MKFYSTTITYEFKIFLCNIGMIFIMMIGKCICHIIKTTNRLLYSGNLFFNLNNVHTIKMLCSVFHDTTALENSTCMTVEKVTNRIEQQL